MKVLGIIAARGGSKGVKNKNIKLLEGKPLIVYSIEHMINWGKCDKFIVSTDSEEIADVSKEQGVEVPFMRPSELAGDYAGKIEVLRHALLEAERCYDTTFDVIVDLDATSPIRTVEDIENMYKIFEDKKADCVFSVVRARKNPYFNMVEETEDGTVRVCKNINSSIKTRQTAPNVYEMNASIYFYRREYLLDKNNNDPYSGRTFVYRMKEESAVDIDTERDFDFVEFLINTGRVKI